MDTNILRLTTLPKNRNFVVHDNKDFIEIFVMFNSYLYHNDYNHSSTGKAPFKRKKDTIYIH